MSLTYYKRFRMEMDLRGSDFSGHEPPSGYQFVPWDECLLDVHAGIKFESFRDEVDANVFPCLGEMDGCIRLMTEISQKEAFFPDATWLVRYDAPQSGRWEYCGTVQGIRDKKGRGAIQNLGITPHHRNRHLGSCLMYQALRGFQAAGIRRAILEVTAQNHGAIRLYRRMGFCKIRTVYKAVELAYS